MCWWSFGRLSHKATHNLQGLLYYMPGGVGFGILNHQHLWRISLGIPRYPTSRCQATPALNPSVALGQSPIAVPMHHCGWPARLNPGQLSENHLQSLESLEGEMGSP